MTPSEAEITAQLYADGGGGPLDPLVVFDTWLAEARKTEPADAEAMALATVDAEGMPDCRIVLLKARTEAGFTFYTNTRSVKGAELAAVPRAALNFHWKSLGRQVRIRGTAVPVAAAVADAYFASRPRGSQIGAVASDQSRPLDARQTLAERFGAAERRFAGQEVPRPDYWSGYTVDPAAIEFWRNSEFRLHDRVLFTRAAPDAPWTRRRLYP
ncbi:MAG TPA: pyridoxamine 5'-phosphate oxidase [Devosiaceae bacterium]|nr:pyridoxamine 5'-phosphate oxidase [Devosiaceae bacterium]